MTMSLRARRGRRSIRLWIPLFLVLPFVALVALLLAPLVLLAAFLLWPIGLARPLLLAGPLLYRLACELRGLKIDVGTKDESVRVHFGKDKEGGKVMNDSHRKVLEMLAENKITVDEASRLLGAIDQPAPAEGSTAEGAHSAPAKPKYLRVQIEPNAEEGSTSSERVNVRVPLGVIRAGMKLTALIPPHAAGKVNEALSDKGIDLDLRNLKTEDLEQLLQELVDLEVDVHNGKEKVHVYVE
jgi:hypothetical protein